jgi:hypothetical protein
MIFLVEVGAAEYTIHVKNDTSSWAPSCSAPHLYLMRATKISLVVSLVTTTKVLSGMESESRSRVTLNCPS